MEEDFSLLASMIGALVMQAITQSMYAIGVPAFALQAIKAVVVILVILLYSDQVKGFLRRINKSKAGDVDMLRKVNHFFSKNRKLIPAISTALLAFAAYGIGAYFFVGMRNPQVFLNLFRNSSYLLISGIGMTFVILTGGIDLSVSGVIALTTVASAVLLREGMNAWVVIILMLLMGMSLGATMGLFIVKLKVQPFIATLAGMWFARGMCFFISDDAVNINNPIFQILGRTKILIPGLKELAEKQGSPAPYITIPVVVGFILLIIAIFVSKYTPFGRTVYAIGGNEGRNEQSARLMGLPVNKTKLLVYTFNGLCSALSGLAFSLFVFSGHGLYAPGAEMEVIASVVMGGTMLSGGSGYVFGTFFGVMVLAVTQALIQFIGSLSSWWTKIVIGVLTSHIYWRSNVFSQQEKYSQDILVSKYF